MNDKKTDNKNRESRKKTSKSGAKSKVSANTINTDKNMLSEESIRILKERAKTLSAKEVEEKTDDNNISVIEFVLGKEVYAFETKYVREIYPLKDFTVIPGLPSFILGVINVRGQIISVVNLKKLINLPEKGIGELNKVIIIENEKMEFGILADVINGTASINTNTIQNKLNNSSEMANAFLQGITRDHIIIFDANKILNYKDIIIKQE